MKQILFHSSIVFILSAFLQGQIVDTIESDSVAMESIQEFETYDE